MSIDVLQACREPSAEVEDGRDWETVKFYDGAVFDLADEITGCNTGVSRGQLD